VTWDPDAFVINTTIKVFLNYVDAQGGGSQVWESNETKNSYGYVAVKMDPAWLNGNTQNNLTFYLGSLDASVDKQMYVQGGPTVSLVNKPALHYLPPPPTPIKKTSLTIGLPVAIGVVALVVIGLYFGMKKHRKIGLGNIMGRRQGYGVGKSRRQRLNLGRKDGAIRLGEEASTPVIGGFRDKPSTSVELHERAHVREESLGSLVSAPGDDLFISPVAHQGNAFRDEVSRQQTGRG
jgi:hypothetical protein